MRFDLINKSGKFLFFICFSILFYVYISMFQTENNKMQKYKEWMEYKHKVELEEAKLRLKQLKELNK